MKKIVVFFVGLFATFALFAQSISANFEIDKQGWKPGNSIGMFDGVVEWTNIFPPMNHRHGLSFSGENRNGNLFLYINKEVTGLLPNTNYRIRFNMNWVCRMEISALSVFVKVGAMNENPSLELIADEPFYNTFFEKGEIGQNGPDFIVAGRLTPDPEGRPFLQNVNNFNNAFLVNTDDKGRLFLMIGLEPESGDIEDIYLNTLRVLLTADGEAREVSNLTSTPGQVVFANEISIPHEPVLDEIVSEFFEDIIERLLETATEPVFEETLEIRFVPSPMNGIVFFESAFNDLIEMVNVYTESNHLINIFSLRNPSTDRAFQTAGLIPGTYRIEFVLSDGRRINKYYTVD